MKNQRQIFRPRSSALALEPRVMFDGAAAIAVDEHLFTPQSEGHANVTEARPTPAVESTAANPAPAALPTTLLIVDSRVADYQSLLSDLPGNVMVRVINPGESGLAAINSAISGHTDLQSIQIISHGSSGSLTLGTDTITSNTLSSQGSQIQSWAPHLAGDADILLYGCDIGAGTAGTILLTQLAALTGADIAASTDTTGAAAKGGNWTLEQQTGQIESRLTVSDSVLKGYNDLLAAPVNTVPGAQTIAEDNTLTFGAGKIISIADDDGTVQSVSISVAHGTLSLTSTAGLTVSGDGTSSFSITAGTIVNINAALNGLIYRPTANYAGTDTLTIITSDGSTTDTDTVDITVTANATAPVLTLPTLSQVVAEDVPGFFNFTGSNAIILTDADANDLQTLTLSVAHGILLVKTNVVGGITSATSNGTASVTLSGTAAQLSATLADNQGLRYTSALNYNSSAGLGAESLSFNLNDGAHTQTGSIAITVTQVNDAPDLSTKAPATVQEGNTVALSRSQLALSDNALDVDIQTGQQVAAQLMVKINSLPTKGTLSYNGGAVAIDSVVPVTSLGSLTYTHNGTDIIANDSDSFLVTVSDGGGGATPGTISITITPKNIAPSISGAPTLIEGQVKVVAPSIALGDGFDTLANSTIVIDNIVSGNQGTLFIDADNDNIVDAGEALSGSTSLDATQRANLNTQLKFFQNGAEPNAPAGVGAPSYRITVTDAGGGTGVPSAPVAQTITLEVLPNNDDPTLTNTHATTGTALTVGEGTNSTIITSAMLQIADADRDPANTANTTPSNQLVYTIGTRPTQGEIQVNIGGGFGPEGDGWIVLGDGGRFTQAQVTAGQVRYYQTTNVADAPTVTTDNFTFTVRDSAFGYDVWADPANPTSNREGGLRATPTGAIATQEFHIDITPLAAVNTPRTTAHEGIPRPATAGFGGSNMGYTFAPTGGMLSNNSTAVGTWVEANVGATDGGYVITTAMLSYTITRTDTMGTPATGDDVSVTIPPAETVYTLTSPPPNGTIQRLVGGSWQAIPTNGQFTQSDIDTGKIRFVHDGGEDHVSTFGYKVSDGTPNNYPSTFGLDITPTNDRPGGSSGTAAQVTEGTGNAVRLGTGVIGLSDIDNSLDGKAGEGLVDFLWFKVTGLAVDGSSTARGTLERWDGGAWVTVNITDWLPSTLLTATADGSTSGLRYIHDGSEPLAYTGGPKVTFTYIVRDDLAAPGTAFDTNATAPTDVTGSAQSNQSASITATINIIPVNNAPQIADKPGDADPTIGATITSGGVLTGVNNVLTIAVEGGDSIISNAYLVGIDPDNTTVQRQYVIKSTPTQGILMLNDVLLGVGSTFTQDDIDNNRVKYRHNGNEIDAATTDGLGTYHDKFHFVLSDAISDDTGAGASNYNTFLIALTPTNDAPTLTGPSGIILIDSATPDNNPVPGFVVADPDLTANVLAGLETDFVQATVRLLTAAGDPITNYTTGLAGSGVSFGYTAQAGGLWAVTQNGNNNILQIQGTRNQVNAALAGLTVTFAANTDSMYKLQVIVDDRMRDIAGALVTTSNDANGGELNQGATAGATPTAVPTDNYNWVTQATLAAGNPNIAATTVDLRASLVNDAATLAGTTAQTLFEDVRTQITGDFDIADPESAAFNTPVTVTLTVGSGTLDVAGTNAQTSFTPSGGQAITISGDTTGSVTLTGRAADIKALLNGRNFANDAADANGGLFYKGAANVNHDTNGASDGDVTLTVALADTGSVFGGDVGAGSVSNNPANITRALTITPVNDAPTVTAGSQPVAINGATAVSGFVISDVDNTDGGALNDTADEADFIQATVRLLPATGSTPLTEGAHSEVVFTSSSAGSVAVDTTYTGNGKALVIRGTLVEVNAYLSGLQVALSGSLLNNNTGYRVQVVADDRLRTTGAGGGVLDGSNAANGGKNTNGSTGVADVPTDAFTPYEAAPSLTYNIAANTRIILSSNVNEAPSFAALDNTPTFTENGAAVVLDANATLSDPELTAYSNWNAAVLTLARQGGANADDVFSLTGSGSTGINFSGSDIRNDSTVVGTFTNAGGTLAITFNASASNEVAQLVLQAIKYSNSNNNPPTSVTIGYTINDGDTDADRAGNGQGTGGALTGTGSITVGITPTNDAPTLTGLTGKTYTENSTSVVIGTNAVPGDPELTIFAANAGNWGNASLTISRNGGANVEDIFLTSGTLSTLTQGSALTDGATSIGTVATNSAGTLKITFVEDVTTAQVQTAIRQIAYSNSRETLAAAGSASVTLNWLLEDGDTDADRATNPQGSGGNKTVTVAQTITLNGINDAPVLSDTVLSLSQAEDSAVPSGAVGSLISTFAAANISDVDTAAVKGLAITTTDSSHGTWYYSTNGGTNWTSFTATDATARLLAADANTRIYFKPTGDWHGGPIAAALTVRAWDTTSGSNGGTADLSVPGTSTGAATAFSTATDTVALTVTPVNDAPSLSGTNTLPAVTEDNTSPAITAANIATALTYSDATDNQTGNAGGNTATAHTALAIVGNAATAAQGTWEYTLNNGTNWTAVATTVGNTTAIVLDLANANHQVRFVPALNFAGTPGSLSLRAADGTWDSNTGVRNISSAVGGTGAWSNNMGELAISVSAVNDPPVAVDDTHAVTEDSGTPSTGNVITGIGSPNTTADSDLDNVIGDLSLSGVRAGTEAAAGAMTAITAGTTSVTGGTVVVGTYGTLTIGADGSYSYVLDNTKPAINALQAGETLSDNFAYTLKDPGNLTDVAQITITINGHTDGGALSINPVDGNAAATGQATVHEAGLTTAANTSETTSGTILVDAPEGIASITIGGTTLTVAQLSVLSVASPSAVIDTGEGELRVTGISTLSGPAAAPTSASVSYTYTLKATIANALPADTESTDTIALIVTDNSLGAATANNNLVIQIVDDTPTANPDTNSITQGIATVTGNVVTTGAGIDHIGADTTATPVSAIAGGVIGTARVGSYGSLTLAADGSYTYALNNENAAVIALRGSHTLTDSFIYTITDADGDTSTATVTLTIAAVDNPPVAVDDSGHSPDGRPVTIPLLANDSDPDGDTVTVTTIAGVPLAPGGSVSIPEGLVTLNADGTITFAPNAGVQGQVLFPYEITDGNDNTATAYVNITVVPEPTVNAPDTITPLPPAPPLFGDQGDEPDPYFLGDISHGVFGQSIPFAPVVYVQHAVQLAQHERMTSDSVPFSMPDWVRLGEVESQSIGAGLGFTPTLFVQQAVRASQAQGEIMNNLVNGRLTRLSLSSDRLIPTPDLSQPNPLEISPPTTRTDVGRLPEIGRDQRSEVLVDARLKSDIPLPVNPSTMNSGHISLRSAPSFSEQLRAAGGHMPNINRQALRPHSTL